MSSVRTAEPLGVYVHVPFCSRRCDYCAFATWTDRDHLWARYASACGTELASLVEGVWAGRGPATSVFFGGGTPSLLPAELLVGVLAHVRETFGVAEEAEVTVECNPESVTAEKLMAYRSAGVTRLSLGVQSMVPSVLAVLGRQHTPGAVRRAAELAGGAGFERSYNVDLIFGAVGETVTDWEASLEAVMALQPRPSHVSAYALTVEPGTPLSRSPSRYPDDDDQADKYLAADEILGRHGFEWYEISNWALPGEQCRHNLLYWQQGDYAGVGCAAHSHRGGERAGGRRWWNVRTPERYCDLVEKGRSAEAAGEDLSAAERGLERLFLSLRTHLGVPASSVPAELFAQGLLELKGPRGVLTRRGRLLANDVAARLAPEPVLSGSGRG